MTDLCALSTPVGLDAVTTPSRYIGGEQNQIVKDLNQVDIKFGVGFPDCYEVGMSHLGLKIIYHILNLDPKIAAERVFTPWVDRVAQMKAKGMGLTTLENKIPLKYLDILGFSLQYELAGTNILLALDLGGIPLLQADRDGASKMGDPTWSPLVIGGGPVTFNPEPYSDFFDLFLIGEAEDAISEIMSVYRECKQKNMSRQDILIKLAQHPGIYVPSLYESKFNSEGRLIATRPRSGSNAPARVTRRVVKDLDQVPFPTNPVIPFMNIVHDRVSVEIQRGCTRGCRFCQAGMIYRPTRQRSPEKVKELLFESLKNTGYEEASLLSLSNGDYGPLNELLSNVMPSLHEQKVAVSLPSMRVDTLKKGVADEIKKVRKTGFTLAPEVGSEKMRKIINKGISHEDVIKATQDAFAAGWRSLKFYFMIGLPLENDEDILAIAKLAKDAKNSCRGNMAVTVSASTHSPKPHTPFQWAAMDNYEEIIRKQRLLKNACYDLGIKFKFHSPDMTFLEGILARGDRRTGRLILNAYKKGLIYTAWTEHCEFEKWKEVLDEWSQEMGVPLSFWLNEIPEEAALAWDHIDCGVFKEWLLKDWKDAQALNELHDCALEGACYDCGGCDYPKDVVNRVFSDFSPKEEKSSEIFEPMMARSLGIQSRLRIQYSKQGEARLMGHLELTRIFSRALRKLGLPLKYSEGFHPMPKIVFSPALGLGIESLDEYVEMTLECSREAIQGDQIIVLLNEILPKGIQCHRYKVLDEQNPSITKSISGALFQTKLGKSSQVKIADIETKIQQALQKDELRIRRMNGFGESKEINVRPFLEQAKLLSQEDSLELQLELKFTQTGTIRPQEFIDQILFLPPDLHSNGWVKMKSIFCGV